MKRHISLTLAIVLIFSALTLFSASAETNAETTTNRYYFYMPAEWYNEYTDSAGIYWWEGTGACSSYPGYKANKTDVDGLYYYDVPKDVSCVIWNNLIVGGTDYQAPEYSLAKQTGNIGTEYYDINESINYPLGTTSFDNMVYVIDYSTYNEWDWTMPYPDGEWYYYYGNGEYGFTPEKGDEFFSDRAFYPEESTTPTNPITPPKPVLNDITVYFVNTVGWEHTYLFYFDNILGSNNVWPGEEMTYVGENAEGYPVYSGICPEVVSGIIFTNGEEQSFDITSNVVDGAAFELTDKLNGSWRYKTYMYTPFAYGDTTLDGEINIKDATLIQKHLAKLCTLEDDALIVADVNRDNRITISDVTLLQKQIAGL